MEKIRCPQCGKETRQNTHGKSKAGSQRYLCKYCNKTYVTKPKWRRYNEETKKQAIKLYVEGNSGRAVVRILGIRINTCIYWIKSMLKLLKNKSQTYTVESVNSDLRYYIPPLKRKSKCFFRSIDTSKSGF